VIYVVIVSIDLTRIVKVVQCKKLYFIPAQLGFCGCCTDMESSAGVEKERVTKTYARYRESGYRYTDWRQNNFR